MSNLNNQNAKKFFFFTIPWTYTVECRIGREKYSTYNDICASIGNGCENSTRNSVGSTFLNNAIYNKGKKNNNRNFTECPYIQPLESVKCHRRPLHGSKIRLIFWKTLQQITKVFNFSTRRQQCSEVSKYI